MKSCYRAISGGRVPLRRYSLSRPGCRLFMPPRGHAPNVRAAKWSRRGRCLLCDFARYAVRGLMKAAPVNRGWVALATTV